MNAATKETFPEANLLLTAPPGEEERVFDLAVHHYELGYISRWQPTEEERAAIAAGGPVWVSVWAQGGPPPINVFGVTPFVQAPEAAGPTEAEIQAALDGMAENS